MNKRKFRVKKSTILDGCQILPCYKVQMLTLGFFWVTVKEFIEEYPEMLGVHVCAKSDAQDLLDELQNPY